jgi:hypothetical protein
MTSQEQEMIAGLIDRVQKTQLSEKDPQAEQMLQGGLGRNPDSIYILAQTVLVQKYALDQAQKQLADLKSQVDQARQQQQQQPKHATSFLGSIFGSHDDTQTSQSPSPTYTPQAAAPPPYTPVQNYAPAGYVQQPGNASAASQFGAPQSSGGGFLRSAMQTATGVAAGALAFQGIESLMHGFGGGGGSSFGGGRPEEVVNNYYGSDNDRHENRDSLSNDVEDRRDDGSFFDRNRDASSSSADNTDQFAGTGNDDRSSLDDDSSNLDDTDDSNYADDNSSDDSSGSDDSSFS